jgi:hypothetical protein
MKTKMQDKVDTITYFECKKDMHVDCGVTHIPKMKKGKPVKKSLHKCWLFYYCSNVEEVLDEEFIKLSSSSGPGIVSKQIAQQRRDVLAGKKGIERMMEAQESHSAHLDHDFLSHHQ